MQEFFKVEPRFVLIFLLFIALIHSWALLTSAYFFYWWLDMAMHFMGGLWVALCAFFALKKYSPADYVLLALLLGAAGVLGILWEFMEFGLDVIFNSAVFQGDLMDTLSDLFFDLLGGATAYLFIISKKNSIIKE